MPVIRSGPSLSRHAYPCQVASGLHPLVLKALDMARGRGTEPPSGEGGNPEELAVSILRPLVDHGLVTVQDLRLEGFTFDL